MTRTPAERTQLVVMLFVVALYLGHSLVFYWPQPFYIEDSAISFAYARHLVEGEGLVAYPGGERVEGYSNALWTFLLAAWYAIGVEPWASSKLMGAIFGTITLFFAWGLARRARPEAQDPLAVVAPLLLACSSQFVIWNASGLENSLFNVLLSGGMWSLTREIQEERKTPWSALAFFGLTMTRPDGMMYAALGLFARMLGTVARRQWAALPLWILAFAAPYAAYNAWRYDYFGWWFPNTYYAKERDFKPFNWTGGGWKQIRDYMTQYGIVFAAPLVVVAMTGLSTWRRWVGLVLLAFFALFLLWDGRSGIPAGWSGEWSRVLAREWNDARVLYLLFASVTLGAITFGRKGWEARGMLWAALCGGIFFVVATGPDWMKAFRWFSLTSVPLFTLLGVGIGALAERLPWSEKRVAGWLPARVLWATPMVVALAFPNVNGSWTFANSPETAPRDVHKRVKYMAWVQRRLHLEQVTLMDVDMGAHMWWSGWDIVDIAGLVDVSMAHHKKYNRAFIAEYVFEERKPDFAHVHGSWARTSKIHLAERWDDDYVEIPGYPSGRRSLHVGNHVRKEHFAGTAYTGPEGRAVTFADGVALAGWDVPAPQVAPGGKLYVATWWKASLREHGFRVLAFLADGTGVKHVAEVAPGYDWYRPEKWQPDEIVYGRWSIPVPERLAAGSYTLGFVVLDEETGAVIPFTPPAIAGAALDATAPVDATAPRFMAGEWLS
ncbi:MAG: ArnT family glycosyltransferase, partial [Myxococcota bacterium]